MSSSLVIITGLIYAAIAVDQAFKANAAMTIVFAGYAFSNVGLWLSVK